MVEAERLRHNHGSERFDHVVLLRRGTRVDADHITSFEASDLLHHKLL
jgi:hypothetical protein